MNHSHIAGCTTEVTSVFPDIKGHCSGDNREVNPEYVSTLFDQTELESLLEEYNFMSDKVFDCPKEEDEAYHLFGNRFESAKNNLERQVVDYVYDKFVLAVGGFCK